MWRSVRVIYGRRKGARIVVGAFRRHPQERGGQAKRFHGGIAFEVSDTVPEARFLYIFFLYILFRYRMN